MRRRAGAAFARAALAAALAGGLLGVVALPVAGAEPAPCDVRLDGVPLGATEPASPIEVPADGVVVAAVESGPPIRHARVTIGLWPVTFPAFDQDVNTTPPWTHSISLREYSQVAVGVYEVVVDTDGCRVSGWVRVVGRAPWMTPLGIASIVVLGVGVLIILSAIRGGGRIRAFVGGAIVGVGLLVFTQQMGVSAVTPTSALIWTLAPGTLSTAVQSLVRAGFEVGGGYREPPTPGPTPRPPTTTAEPPSTVGAEPPTAGAEPHTTAAEPATAGAEPPTATAEPPTATAEPPTTGSAGAAAGTGAAGTGAGAASIGTGEDPPRSAHARLEAPDAVVAGQAFELVVGLAEQADRAVISEPLVRPATSIGAYTITIQVIADGFSLAQATDSWRVNLPVTADRPYPAAIIHLVPHGQAEPVRPASIRAMFSIDGHPIGLAIRPVAVVREAALLSEAPAPPAEPGWDMSLPSGAIAPDLTVRIERAESQSSGRLLVQLLTADPTIPVPDAPLVVDIGRDPAQDLQRVIAQMNAVEGRPTQYVSLRGIGLTIADQLPTVFWDVLREVAGRLDRPPMVLFLSAEPYVPWELAIVDPPLDPAAPPFLSAQANVGRWVLGQRRPKLPPPTSVPIDSLAVVSGVYTLPGWEQLVEAEAEAADLAAAYGAASVNATTTDVLNLLRGNPSADLIHFAVHGNYDGEGLEDGLILVDGTALDPLAIRGVPIEGAPFVFLNACQVGRGNEVLGDHAGMAEAFLFAGASGVIAPLWSIDDRVAREIAIRFYERALAGESPADILRTERSAFRDSPEVTSSTYLAYQYFGHPALRLARQAP